MLKTYLNPNAILDGSISIEKLSDDVVCKLTKITYSELVNLRNQSLLIPGQQYRIIDYVTTTVQEDSTSAGHQFDIIVTADDVNVLNENARAIQHEGDTYFADCNLESWKISYCIDNDVERFYWADNSVKSTIYIPVSESMREALTRELNSDLDTLICTEIYASNDGIDYYKIDNMTGLAVGDTASIMCPAGTTPQNGVALPETLTTSSGHIIPCNMICLNFQPTEVVIDTVPTVINSDNGKGVIYRMIDEFDNECSYDFKNIQFKNHANLTGDTTYYYTFTYKDGDGSIWDYTLPWAKGFCYGNTIAQYMSGHKIALNNIIFINDPSESSSLYCYNNSFGINCGWSLFKSNCYHNTFGGGSNRNYFGYNCTYNSIKDNCDNNTFGDNCSYNTLDFNCTHNTFGNTCSNNTLYSNCEWMILGDTCYGNIFHDKCYYNQLAGSCSRNTFLTESKYAELATGCTDNTFGKGAYVCKLGSDCTSNIFGNGNQTIEIGKKSKNNIISDKCTGITFGEWCTDNKIGYDSSNITLGGINVYNTFGETSQNVVLGDSCRNNIFGYKCREINFGADCALNVLGDYCNNIDLGEACTVNTFSNSCSNIGFGANCGLNVLGDLCAYVDLGEACTGNTFGNSCSNIGFGGNCTYNTFGNSCEVITGNTIVENVDTQTGFSKIYCQNVKMGDNCKFITFTAVQNQEYAFIKHCKNFTIGNNIGGSSEEFLDFSDKNNDNYEIRVSKNSDGEIKIYCEADLIN